MSSAEQKIAKQEQKVAELKAELLKAESYLDGMKVMLEDMRKSASSRTDPAIDGKPKRRMRLGAKKRVVYQLVCDGLNSIESINNRLDGTTIDKSYARDVVREALLEGDMLGDLEGYFIISDYGKEIINKATIPQDWVDYAGIFEDKGSDESRSPEPKKSAEGVIPPSDSDPLADFINQHSEN